MMSSYMTELELLPQPYMLLRLGKLAYKYVACYCIEWCRALLTLETYYAFKIKITYTPPKYVASTLKVRNNMLSI
jgi:hypothetical protein